MPSVELWFSQSRLVCWMKVNTELCGLKFCLFFNIWHLYKFDLPIIHLLIKVRTCIHISFIPISYWKFLVCKVFYWTWKRAAITFLWGRALTWWKIIFFDLLEIVNQKKNISFKKNGNHHHSQRMTRHYRLWTTMHHSFLSGIEWKI